MTTRKPVDNRDPPEAARPTGILEDRIPADGEQVSHTLNPDRDSDSVRYPDPRAPNAMTDDRAVGAQSNAEVQMGRRTDAGPREAAADWPSSKRSKSFVWLGVAAVVVVFVLLLAVLF